MQALDRHPFVAKPYTLVGFQSLALAACVGGSFSKSIMAWGPGRRHKRSDRTMQSPIPWLTLARVLVGNDACVLQATWQDTVGSTSIY